MMFFKHGILKLTAAAGALAFMLISISVEAQITNNYCATYNPNTSTLNIPCVLFGGGAHDVNLQLTNTAPITLAVSGVSPSNLAPALGQCATFNPANSTVSIPCVVVGSTKFWADFDVSIGTNINVTLRKASSGVPTNCTPLTQPPVGVTVEVVPTGEATGHVATANVQNNTGQQVCFCAEPCMGLRNSSPSAQNFTLYKTSSALCIEAGGQGSIPSFGSCANAPLAIPDPSQRMTFFTESRGDLCALTQTIERELDTSSAGLGMFVAASAIWVITDNFAPDPLLSQQVKELFQQAGLDLNSYPTLKATMSAETATSPGLKKLEKLLKNP